MQNQNPNQNGKSIQNPAMQIPKTPQMNERDFVNDMLATEKYMTSSYTTAIHEASHQHLYDDLLAIYTETEQAQRNLFNLMFQKGWYKLEAQDEQKIQQSYQQHVGYTNQFPYNGGMQ
ncbi:spore coat protein [Bacillus sp. FJAT-50079]|uniref:spore coat protein n=1 Tax=Bacillus sp. FJAT-50079 TaxID=2833577 RepID=UPI001BC90515|nr:spore coat protein [Bacillus sp. FJAT-50079]MBS4208495.1 spore coat protein [Bacillus sp. FJAT-50079]